MAMKTVAKNDDWYIVDYDDDYHRHGDENIVGCDVDNDDNGDYNDDYDHYEEDKRGTQPL